jgi:hypothetical protein
MDIPAVTRWNASSSTQPNPTQPNPTQPILAWLKIVIAGAKKGPAIGRALQTILSLTNNVADQDYFASLAI